MRARRGEQAADGVGHRTIIAPAMQLLQQPQCVGDRLQMGGRLAGERELLAGVAAELFRNPEGMERAEAVPELDEMLVVDREERPLQRREHRQLIVRPLDGRQRRADRFHFFAAVERLAADEQMRNAARLDRVDVGARHVLAEAHEPAEQHRDVARLQRHAGLRSIRLLLESSPAALDGEPLDEGADHVGQRRFDRLRRCPERAAPRVRPRHRQRDDRRLRVVRRPGR